MAAFVVTLLSYIARRVTGTRQLSNSIPGPKIAHVKLEKSFLEKFQEIMVIGDVHGCYDEMIELLKVSNSSSKESSVLKIFVGDLVNKGPKNSQVIDFMINNQDHCLSVRGNHDEVVIREWNKHVLEPNSLPLKNKWIEQLNPDQVNYLISLPFTISLPSLNTIIVHAGLVPGIKIEENNHRMMTNMRNLIEDDKNGQLIPSSATEKGVAWAIKWRGPDHVYFGHDAKRKLQKCSFATGLDTGCVYGNYLTGLFIFGPRKGQFISVKAFQTYQAVEKND